MAPLYCQYGSHAGLRASLPERWAESVVGVRGLLPVVYGARAVVAASRGGLWHGFPDEFCVLHLGPGGVDRIVRRPWAPEPVTPGARARFEDRFGSMSDNLPEDRALVPDVTLVRRAEAELRALQPGVQASLTFAETLPAFIALSAPPDGHLWVRHAATAAELDRDGTRLSTDAWTVFDPAGGWLGTVVLPPGLEVRIITDDAVIGVWRDAMDVQYVRAHRILRPASPQAITVDPRG